MGYFNFFSSFRNQAIPVSLVMEFSSLSFETELLPISTMQKPDVYLDGLNHRRVNARFSRQLCENCQRMALMVTDCLKQGSQYGQRELVTAKWWLKIRTCALCEYIYYSVKSKLTDITTRTLHVNSASCSLRSSLRNGR